MEGHGEKGAWGKWFCLPHPSDSDSASVDSDMYDLPKKEDALLYQSKGKAAVRWALTSFHSLRDSSVRENLRSQPPGSLSSPGGEKPCHRPQKGFN